MYGPTIFSRCALVTGGCAKFLICIYVYLYLYIHMNTCIYRNISIYIYIYMHGPRTSVDVPFEPGASLNSPLLLLLFFFIALEPRVE